MCGIVAVSGIVAEAGTGALAATFLARLEYRGYDSFGFAMAGRGPLEAYRSLEPLGEFEGGLPDAAAVIGHTRWATHGGVALENCHPHVSVDQQFAVVHNGIVENHQALRRQLRAGGESFHTETDTEVITHLLATLLRQSAANQDRRKAMIALRERLTGRNAVVVLFADGEVLALQAGSPLIAGTDGERAFIASDTYAFGEAASLCVPLEEGDIARLQAGRFILWPKNAPEPVAPRWCKLETGGETASLDGYRHYMLKEIMESWLVVSRQPQVAGDLAPLLRAVRGAGTIWITGAGGAYYTALQIAWLLRMVAELPGQAVQAYEIGSQLGGMKQGDVLIAVSQSGETADTIDAVQLAKARGCWVAALVNAPFTTLARLADAAYASACGPEICVLSTKSAVAQIAFGYLLATTAAGRGVQAGQDLHDLSAALSRFLTAATLRSIDQVAAHITSARDLFVLGRDRHVGTALIAALNLKEATCLHAEAFAAGELKHGVIALIEQGTPVIVFAHGEDAAMLNAAAEVAARGAYVIGISDRANSLYAHWLALPEAEGAVGLIGAIVPVQMLAYQIAVRRGLNPDQPRNLAKSVTVR